MENKTNGLFISSSGISRVWESFAGHNNAIRVELDIEDIKYLLITMRYDLGVIEDNKCKHDRIKRLIDKFEDILGYE
jgi:hypothetical protein